MFVHANGYPPACYGSFLAALSKTRHVLAMLLRPLWGGSRPEEVNSWKPFSGDLLRLLEERRLPPVIAVGHSVGATTVLRAALIAPQRFSALILVEPVLCVPSAMTAWALIRSVGLAPRLHPLMRAAAERRRTFEDADQAFVAYRRSRTFRYVSDAGLHGIAAGILSPNGDSGYALAYSPEWESRVYFTGVWDDWDLWKGIAVLQVATMFLRGGESDTFTQRAADLVQARNPGILVREVTHSTHLLPFERPEHVAELTEAFLSDRGLSTGGSHK